MAKKTKKAKYPIIFLIGMIAVIVGFILPMFEVNVLGLAKATSNGFDFIDFDSSSFVSIGAILIFAGAILGFIGGLLPKAKLLKVIGLFISIIGGVILVIGFTTNGGIYKAIGKALFKTASYGFYIILVGWVVSIIGIATNK